MLTLVGGVLGLVSLLNERRAPSLDTVVTTATFGILVIILGIVALAGALRISKTVWSIIILIVGFLAYRFDGGFPWWWGSILLIIGGVIGIIGNVA